ncbi:acetoacetyl-CoA synthetase [Trichonephila clavipes]|nr:acetoacetyl-CoA synthetase [Trichonephila clavipes]
MGNILEATILSWELQGTTESHGCFSGFDYNLPSYAGEVQVPALGKDIYCFDKDGHPVYGQLGELVLTARSPSFPLYLWKDEDGSVMKKTYLSKFPGTWCPGDECWINPKSRGIVIVGRSQFILSDNKLSIAIPVASLIKFFEAEEKEDRISIKELGHMQEVDEREECGMYFIPHLGVYRSDKTNQRKLQRILWRENMDEPIKTFELSTVTYGTTSAPFLATRTLKQLALDEAGNFPLGSSVVMSDMYIDDVLTGAETLLEAKN